MLCEVEPSKPPQESEQGLRIIAEKTQNSEQVDLYYLNSVLVSTGWNKNDDVFDIQEVWSARQTPEDKQFNYMHDETDIIGHITGNIVVDTKGNIISDDTPVADIPDKFDIITSAVLYNSWSTPELNERMASIIEEIEEGKWFVSMECLFNDFNYAVISPNGEHQVVARDEASAFLTKHLRGYGGTGEYQGFKVGRMLKNIAFSGKGLVNQPANPRSVILKDSNPFTRTEAQSINQFDIVRENNIMSSDERLQQQVEDLKSELAAARQELQSKTAEAVAEQIETFEATLAEKEDAIVEAQAAVKAAEAKLAELEEALAKKGEELAEAVAQIEAQEAEAKLLARKAALTEAGATEEEAEETLAAFADATDEMFEQVVVLAKKGFVPFKKKDEEEEDDKEAEAETAEVEAEAGTEVDAEEDEAEASAEEEILEQAEEAAEAALVDAGETDAVKSARSIASEWLTQNVLRTTVNIDS